ncbi:URC4/urg3 family protein [Bdellovibrio sp. SKB1291214]|uniref:URC4/urg3 family protein n=1 Tax=Bdellovibrio sp. SKB1291214 TaxID=1732569 RepID=UPI0020CE85FC|nr:URC4/urg3 family protein [Bdellovibrio sp. SKB1291214]UYL09524.1 URC4/urg3 family protein [Bdellovibrio sp. SKB1291214]
MSNISYQLADVDFLLSPQAVRHCAEKILELTVQDQTHFRYHPEKLSGVVDFVLQVIRENYPELDIPFHSRWGHFRAGGVDRTVWLKKRIQHLDPLEQARIKLDLVIPSVLLDAGAGNIWSFKEESTGKIYQRSEGLGVASFYLFIIGYLSDDLDEPLQATDLGLQTLSREALCKIFQVNDRNPLVGVEGRLQLIQNLGRTVADKKDIFPLGRPGSMVDYLRARYGMKITGPQLLRAVLDGLGDIWPGRLQVDGVNLGDTWQYDKIPGGLACFHKLSQWMTYSLMEPLIEAGFELTDVDQLTGLAEYRNGGLLLDRGLISLKDPKMAEKVHTPDSEIIVEWRGLTVSLLDRIGQAVQRELRKNPSEFPLAKVLEGGTWWAGRKAAKFIRPDGSPPLKIQSDGTVF